MAIAVTFVSAPQVLHAQDVLPWEYAPYKVHCWVSIDPSLGWSAEKQAHVIDQLVLAIQDRFSAAVVATAEPAPTTLTCDILYDLNELKIDSLLGRELVLATSRKHPQGKEARTLDAAMEKFDRVPINAANLQSFQSSLNQHSQITNFPSIANRLKVIPGPNANLEGRDPVAAALSAGEIPIAVVSRAIALADGKEVRILPVQYPWHLQSVLDQYDKIFAIAIRRDDVAVGLELAEIDCTFRTVGAVQKSSTCFDSTVGYYLASMGASAFVPYAKIESADDTIAEVRVRAGELIIADDHPCKIGKSDVLRPTIRRDDRSGQPSFIQVVPWTFLVVGDGSKSKFSSAVFSGIRSSLTGRPNKRLHKLATLVKPTRDATNLKLQIAGKNKIVPGSAVYRRTPGTEDLELVGRTDWRGILRIAYDKLPVVHYEKPLPNQSDPQANADPATVKTKKIETEKIDLQVNAPLYVYYIKNGTNLLARLPIVTGLDELETADLPDDSVRMEAEAFLKGLEGEVLDLVARRQILGRKIDGAMKENKLDDAKMLLEELKTVKGYDDFSEQLNAIQRRILASSETQLPQNIQRRIDKMFDNTRKLMQKHLQDSLVRDKEVAISQVNKS